MAIKAVINFTAVDTDGDEVLVDMHVEMPSLDYPSFLRLQHAVVGETANTMYEFGKENLAKVGK